MNNKYDYINKNYYKLKKKLSNIQNPEWDDIFHDVLIQFLNKNSKQINKLIKTGDVDRYIMQMFKLNCFSDTSPYQRKYNKKEYKYIDLNKLTQEDEPITDEICLKDLMDGLIYVDELFIYKLLYKEYIENKSINPSFSIRILSEESKIPRVRIITKFNNIREQLKKIINKNE